MALWSAAALAALGLLVALHCTGCGGSQQADLTKTGDEVAACESAMAKTVIEAANCNEAQFRVDAVLVTMPQCKGFPHFEVCALRDGGVDAHN